MTPGKPGSPVAKAMAKVSGAVKGAEPEHPGAPVPAGAKAPAAPAARGNGAAAPAAAGTFPTAPVGSTAPVAARTAAPTAPVGTRPATAPGAPGTAGYAAAGSAGAAAAPGAQAKAPTPSPAASNRRVRLTVSRVDPWSVMKMSFLVSVAIGIAFIVMVAVLWLILDGMGVFSSLNRTISDIQGSNSDFNLMDYIALPRVLSLSVVIGVIDVILLTALATLGAFLYNVCSSLVGGVQLTLSDD